MQGLLHMIKKEKSFQIEIVFIAIFSIINANLQINLSLQVFAQIAMIGVLISECINTAVESCVDLITQDFHALAKIAKDAASAAVFLSIISAIFVWLVMFYKVICG